MKPTHSTREVKQLSDVIGRLEARVSQLEAALSVAAQVTIVKVGDSSITLRPSKIDIKSTEITLTGSGKITIKTAGELTLKGSQILQN